MISKILASLSLISLLGCAHTVDYGYVPGSIVRAPASEVAVWNDYGGSRLNGRMGEKFSPLSQINKSNVKRLKKIWQYNTNERDIAGPKSLEITPVYHEGKLFGCSIFNKVFALDAETGKEIWSVDPKVRKSDKVWAYKCRGVALWTDARATGQVCSTRVISNTIDGRILALDANTGERCPDFVDRIKGQPVQGAPAGEVAAWINVMSPAQEENRVAFILKQKDHPWRDEFYMTSAPLVYKDLIIVGGGIADNGRTEATSGAVQAFDVRTGELKWQWDPVPENLKIAGKLNTGTPNVWAPMSADDTRGLIFMPTGAASPDYFGALRGGKDKYASSVVALRVEENGRLLAQPRVEWHFKTVIQDKWDYDAASQPVLTDLNVNGKQVPVVIQGTKMGFVFIMHRETGRPVFPTAKGFVQGSYKDLLKEVSIKGVVPEETIIDDPNEMITETADGKTTFALRKAGSHSKFQPFPPKEWQLHDTPTTRAGLMGTLSSLTPACHGLTWKYDYDGIYSPPSLKGAINFPGAVGGIDWGGVTVDPVNEILYVNQIRIATIAKLYKRDDYNKLLASVPPGGPKAFKEAYFDMLGTPYGLHRFPYMAPNKLPCSDPPYGVMKAISLRDGRVLWSDVFGDFATMNRHISEEEAEHAKAQGGEMASKPSKVKNLIVKIHSATAGVPNFGGSLITSGGILFIAAGADSSFRMFDAKTGDLLHSIDLNQYAGAGSGAATPMTYVSPSNRQIVLLASGGNKFIPGKHGDAIIAFALE